MQHDAAFHLGLHSVYGFPEYEGLKYKVYLEMKLTMILDVYHVGPKLKCFCFPFPD